MFENQSSYTLRVDCIIYKKINVTEPSFDKTWKIQIQKELRQCDLDLP